MNKVLLGRVAGGRGGKATLSNPLLERSVARDEAWLLCQERPKINGHNLTVETTVKFSDC